MKRLLSVLFAAALITGISAVSQADTVFPEAGVPIDEENFPDKTFREYFVKNFDQKEPFDVLTKDEAELADQLSDLPYRFFCDLEGLQYFTNINFINLKYSMMAEVDLTPFSKLEEIDIEGDPIRRIKFGKHDKLTRIDTYRTSAKELDLTGCPNLVNLSVNMSEVSKIDVSKCSKLESIYAEDFKGNTIDLSHNPELKYVFITYSRLKTLDLSNCKKLEKVNLESSYIDMTGLKLPDNFKHENLTEEFNIGFNYNKSGYLTPEYKIFLESLDKDKDGVLDLSERSSVKELVFPKPANGESFLKINLGMFPNLEKVVLSGNGNLEKISFDNTHKIKSLDLSGCGLTEIDLSELPDLEELNVSGNQLNEIDLSKNPKLKKLNISGNQIDTLDISKNPSMTEVDISGTDIKELDTSKNPGLKVKGAKDVKITLPSPTPTNTATPTPTNTATPTPEPTATATPEPTATETPAPTEPAATPVPVVEPIITSVTDKNGITFKVSGKTAFVSAAAKKAKKVVIPATVKIGGKTYKVTKIGDSVFKNNKKITAVTIGKNVTVIGKDAFNNASKLKTVSFKGAAVKTVGKGAFKGINSKASFKFGKKISKKKIAKIKSLIKASQKTAKKAKAKTAKKK